MQDKSLGWLMILVIVMLGILVNAIVEFIKALKSSKHLTDEIQGVSSHCMSRQNTRACARASFSLSVAYRYLQTTIPRFRNPGQKVQEKEKLRQRSMMSKCDVSIRK